MIHDLLLALLGFGGDVFEFGGNDERLFILRNRDQFEKFEISLIEKLLNIASQYMIIREWVDKMLSSSSLYNVGLAVLVEKEVLNVYESDIEEMEAKILSFKDGVSLSYIHVFLGEKWNGLFNDIITIIRGDNDEHVVDLVIENKSINFHK